MKHRRHQSKIKLVKKQIGVAGQIKRAHHQSVANVHQLLAMSKQAQSKRDKTVSNIFKSNANANATADVGDLGMPENPNVHAWSVNDVQRWVLHISNRPPHYPYFKSYFQIFHTQGIDGQSLLKQTSRTLANDLLIKNLHRNTLLQFIDELRDDKKGIVPVSKNKSHHRKVKSTFSRMTRTKKMTAGTGTNHVNGSLDHFLSPQMKSVTQPSIQKKTGRQRAQTSEIPVSMPSIKLDDDMNDVLIASPRGIDKGNAKIFEIKYCHIINYLIYLILFLKFLKNCAAEALQKFFDPKSLQLIKKKKK